MSIEVSNESGLDVSEEELVSVARFVIKKMKVHPAAELSMVLLDTAAMADLHMRWMDLPGPTDVMSFPMDELEPGGRPDAPEPGPSMLGDIVLCPEFAADQATAAGHTLGQELALLTVHGVLHLLGYDHAEPDEEKEMFALQRKLLEEWVADQVEAYRFDRQSEKDRRLLDKSRLLRRTVTGIGSLIGAIALIGFGGLFAAIDAAISTVSIARVEEMMRDERPGAVRLARVINERPRYINLVVLLRIACEITATALLVDYLYEHLGLDWGLIAAAAIMVVISFVLIGVGPRTLGRQNAYSIALGAALPLQAISVLLTPISRLLVLIGNALTPGRGFRNGPFASEIELREVVDLAQQRGVVADDERRMIQSVFELGDTPAREVMVPRTEMVWIENDKTAGQATSLAVRSGHSRIPVIGENVDDVVGVVYLKDLVERTYYSNNGGRDTEVSAVMRPAVFVPDSKPLDALLREMQRDRNHMALLVDEYGAIAGLVTIEDVLEEIVGEIADEYDTDEVAPVEELGDQRYRVSTRLPIEDLGELYDREFDEDLDVDTVGGLLALELGRVPLPGAEVDVGGAAAARRRRPRSPRAGADRHRAGQPCRAGTRGPR